MGNYTTYVGMDVHARSIDCSAVDVVTGEVFRRAFTGNPDASEVAEWVRSLPQPAYCAYESGCTGFHLCRDLRGLGVACDVIAVSTLARSTKDRKGKCDKRDARAIRREIANPDSDYSVVWVPDKRTEGQRELVRSYRVAVDDLKRAKQRLSSMLLRHGYVWDERTPTGRLKKASGRAYDRWLDGIGFDDPASEAAFGALRRQIRNAQQEVDELAALVGELAEAPENKPYVDALAHIKGIERRTALLARVEFGDFSRFSGGRKASMWLGTTPSDHSSGGHDAHGPITKSGNKHLRRALVEALTGIDAWKSAKKSPPKGSTCSAACRDAASRCNERIRSRYRHLREDAGKCHNVAKVAVVNELIRWIWAIGLEVQREQEAAAL